MGRTPFTRKQKRTEEFKSVSREFKARAKHIEPDNNFHNEDSPQAFKANAVQVEISGKIGRTKKDLTRKINKSKQSKSASRKSNARAEHITPNNGLHNEYNSQAFENSAIQSEANSENNGARNEENSQAFEDNEMQAEENYETAMEIERPIEAVDSNPIVKKYTRGPTNLEGYTSFPFSRIEVEFNQEGEPIGQGSVMLSSYLGRLVRKHVPVTLNNWKHLSDDLKVVLWESIQAGFQLDDEWEKRIIFQKMGCIWRGSKCRLIRQIQKAETKKEKMKLKPTNIESKKEWKEFIKLKTSLNFKTQSEKYKAMVRNRTPHTCGRKGFARLVEEMKEQSHDPSSVSKSQVWIKSHTRKNGEPVSMMVADAIEKIKKNESEPHSRATTNVEGDALSQMLERSKAMARGKDTQINLFQNRISKLENMLNMLMENEGKGSWREGSTSEISEHDLSLDKCDLLDWGETDEIVAEGRVVSSDPNELVHKIPLGPNAMKILIDCPRKANAYLWRPTPSLTYIGDAEDDIVAWPANRVVIHFTEHSKKDNASKPSRICKIYDWGGSEELVAEGRLHSSDSKELVNGIPLGPYAVIVWVDNQIKGDAFLWRPMVGMTCIAEALGSKIAWPESKVVIEKVNTATSRAPTFNTTETPAPTFNAASSPTPTVNSAAYRMSASSMVKNKCKLIDLCGTGVVVAEGRAINPSAFALGENAVKVSVDFVKVPNALLWRPSWKFKCIEDVTGNIISWPAANVIMESNYTAAVDKGSRSKKPKNDACKDINELIQVINTCHD